MNGITREAEQSGRGVEREREARDCRGGRRGRAFGTGI